MKEFLRYLSLTFLIIVVCLAVALNIIFFFKQKETNKKINEQLSAIDSYVFPTPVIGDDTPPSPIVTPTPASKCSEEVYLEIDVNLNMSLSIDCAWSHFERRSATLTQFIISDIAFKIDDPAKPKASKSYLYGELKVDTAVNVTKLITGLEEIKGKFGYNAKLYKAESSEGDAQIITYHYALPIDNERSYIMTIRPGTFTSDEVKQLLETVSVVTVDDNGLE